MPASVLENVRHPVERDALGPARRPDAPPQARPPGGILIVAILSAISGAIMGFVFGGYISLALAILITLPLGIAIGMWARGLGD